MFRQLLSIFAAAITLAACTAPNVRVVEGVMVVDAEEACEGDDIPVEALAESVEVIRLEAADNAFFEFDQAFFSENYIAIKAVNGLVRIFGRDGRFAGVLEGVDERSYVYSVAIDEGRGMIYASASMSDSLLMFDLWGRCKTGIKLKAETNKAVVAADSSGVALVQYDFIDRPSGYNAVTITPDSVRYAVRQSLSIRLVGEHGAVTGYNYENCASRLCGRLHFMPSFCDTLFRYDTSSNSIVPELAVNIKGRHGADMWDEMQDTAQAASWLRVIALPCHYIVKITGANAQNIIVDRERLTATKASIVCSDSLKLHFADGYAYAILPPCGKENGTLVRWKLAEKPNHSIAPKPDIPQPGNVPQVEWDKDAATQALELSRQGKPEEALSIIDAAIDQAEVKHGHPALAFAYAVKGVLHTQLMQPDSAYYYRHLVNAPLTTIEQGKVNHSMMEIHTALGNNKEAQYYAMLFGAVMIGDANESRHYSELTEKRERINDLSQQAKEDSRLLHCLLSALAFVVIAACALVYYLRRQKQKHIAASRCELQALMEQRIENDGLRAEIMKNHAIVHRISHADNGKPLTEEEEDMLHSITEILYPGLKERLQSQAAVPLSFRELTICFLIRFGVPQSSVATLLDWKANTLRTAKSRIKREHFHLPVDTELDDFIREV